MFSRKIVKAPHSNSAWAKKWATLSGVVIPAASNCGSPAAMASA
jgi:hypothetical protein